MSTTELVLAVLLIIQSVAWMAHDYKHFEPAEFVRRAERGLGVGIREGQANGTVETTATAARRREQEKHGVAKEHRDPSLPTLPGARDLSKQSELYGPDGQSGIYAMTDGVTDEQFEEALTEAKIEGNLSRANVGATEVA